MERKILLEKSRHRNAVNVSNVVGVDLYNKTKILNGDNISGNFSLYDQYNAERDACDKYRFIFVVNPICTNVLFNVQTEIVQNEGSNDVIVLGDTALASEHIITENGTPASAIQNTCGLTRVQAIRDTEYSHKSNGGFVYHCGLDIFNNHMLRADGFTHVNRMNPSTVEQCSGVYNTINDFLRDGEGSIVEASTNPNENATTKHPLHLYTADTILSLKEAFINRIKEKDGWIGFTNPGNIEIPNSAGDTSGVTINRMLANNKACEFIDMYPDRSLYSFIPKYNKYRGRIEKNWDYCLTYPYSADTNMVDTVCGGVGGAISAEIISENGNSLLCKSSFKHTLKAGGKINLYYYVGSGSGETFTKYKAKVGVVGVGNTDGSEKDRYFSIRLSDISTIYDKLEDGFFYKKVSNGGECRYYFRIYKKIKRHTEDGELDLRSDINKLAYGENIYGDRVAQIVYTDDVDISELKDHMGSIPTELYLTVVKRNAGHTNWYNGDVNDDEVEYSHCFGEVTAGVDFGSASAAQFDYNIRYLHNINVNGLGAISTKGASAFGETILFGVPSAVSYDITIDDDLFYGDVVEFDISNFTETEISPVLFRFNTAQREYTGAKYRKVYYDKFVSDDYDLSGFPQTFQTRQVDISNVKSGNTEFSVLANVCPEGYFYNPHTKIKVRERSTAVERRRAKFINYSYKTSNVFLDSTKLYIAVPTDYNFKKGDTMAFFDEGGLVDGKYYQPTLVWGLITASDGMKLVVEFEGTPFGATSAEADAALSNGPSRRFKAYYSEDAIPTYAAFDPETRSFVWRSVVAPSTMAQDYELYDTPFANGRFYIEKNITFFLRRQDPFGDFGLLWSKWTDKPPYTNPMDYYRLESSSDRLDLSSVFNFYNNLNNICY